MEQNKFTKTFFTSFFFMPIIGYVLTTYIDISIDYLYNFAAILVFLQIVSTGKKIKSPTYINIWGLFTLYSILSDVFISQKLTNTNISIIQYFYSNNYISTYFLLLAIENTSFNNYNPQYFYRLITITIYCSAIVSIIQIVNPLFFVNTVAGDKFLFAMIDDRGSSLSIFSWLGRNEIGMSFIPLISTYLGMSLTFKDKSRNFVALLGGIVVFLSKTRYIMLIYLIALSQRYFFDRNRIYSLLKVFIYLVVMLTASYYSLKYIMKIDVDSIIMYRILESDKASINEMSAGTRFYAFEVFSQVFPKNPIFGSGNQLTDEVKDILGGRSSTIHVGWLYLFYAYGLVGGLLFVLFFYLLLRKLDKVAKKSGYWGSYTAFITFIIANMTLPYLFIFEMGLVIALIIHKIYEESTDNNEILELSKTSP